MTTPNNGSNSIACMELTIAPCRSEILICRPLIREVRKSMFRRRVCEKSACISEQCSNAVACKRQSLRLPFCKSHRLNCIWFVLLMARLMYRLLQFIIRTWLNVDSPKLVPINFAVDELYPVEGTSGERDVGEIALPENNIGYLGRFESGINKSDVTESTLFDTPVGSVDSRFHTFGEGKPGMRFLLFRRVLSMVRDFRMVLPQWEVRCV